MKSGRIYGYTFKIVSEKHGDSWVAYCPGIGGVYEEEKTEDRAIAEAYESACALIDARAAMGELIAEEGPFVAPLYLLPRVSLLRETASIQDNYLHTVPC